MEGALAKFGRSDTDAGSTTRAGPAAAGLGLDTVSLRRAGEPKEIVRIAFDPAVRLVRAYAGGCWSIDETERYLAGLSAFVAASRARFGKARVLLDRRDVTVQSPDVAALLANANGRIFEPEDKIALVVHSSMAKTSLRQRMPHPGTKAFLSMEAAETWLSAFGRG